METLNVMKQNGIEPSSETYGALMQAHAKFGEIDEILKIISDCQTNEILLNDEALLQTIYVLALNDHEQHIDQVFTSCISFYSKKLYLRPCFFYCRQNLKNFHLRDT